MSREKKFSRCTFLGSAALGLTAGALAACSAAPAPQVVQETVVVTAVQPSTEEVAALEPAELSFWIGGRILCPPSIRPDSPSPRPTLTSRSKPNR